MIFFFDLPSSLDKTQIQTLPLKEKLFDLSFVQEKEKQFLVQVDDLRNQFKHLINKEQIIKIIEQDDGLLNYQKILDDYLKTNVDMLAIVGFKQCNHPCFQYKTFLSNKDKKYSTEKDSNQVACAAEILMVRYSYAFAFQLDAYKYLQIIRSKIENTFQDEKLVNCGDQFISAITNCLRRFGIGYNQIKKVYNVMPDLLSFLVNQQKQLIPELKSTTVLCIKNLLEINANIIYAEQLRFLHEYKNLSLLCKTSYDKLIQVYDRFNEIKQEISNDILVYCQCAQLFLKAYCLWARNKINEANIKSENYGDKNFTTTSIETLSLSKSIVKLGEQFIALKADADFYDYGVTFFQKLFIPQSQKNIQLYTGIYHQKVEEPDPELILKSIKEPYDYYEIIINELF